MQHHHGREPWRGFEAPPIWEGPGSMGEHAAEPTQQNRELVTRWQDAYNSGDLDALEELLGPEWVSNSWPEGMPRNVESAKLLHRLATQAFPDLHYTTELLLAVDEWVVQRYVARGTHLGAFAGQPPSRNLVTCRGVNLFRVSGGRIVEHWAFADDIGILAQVGVALPPEWLAVRHKSEP